MFCAKGAYSMAIRDILVITFDLLYLIKGLCGALQTCELYYDGFVSCSLTSLHLMEKVCALKVRHSKSGLHWRKWQYL